MKKILEQDVSKFDNENDQQNYIQSLKNEAEYSTKRQNETESELLKQTFHLNRQRAEFAKDRFLMSVDKRPESNEMIREIEKETDNNPEVAFEKFKRFAKENFGNIGTACRHCRYHSYDCHCDKKFCKTGRKHCTESWQRCREKRRCRRINWKFSQKFGQSYFLDW